MPNLNSQSKYLKSDMVKEGDIVKFLNAGQLVEKDNPFKKGEKKTNFEVSIELPDGSSKIATINFTSQKALTAVYGSSTENWVNLTAKVNKVKQNVGGQMKDVVYLTPIEREIQI